MQAVYPGDAGRYDVSYRPALTVSLLLFIVGVPHQAGVEGHLNVQIFSVEFEKGVPVREPYALVACPPGTLPTDEWIRSNLVERENADVIVLWLGQLGEIPMKAMAFQYEVADRYPNAHIENSSGMPRPYPSY